MKKKIILLLGCAMAAATQLSAQVADAIGQVDSSQQRRQLEQAALKPGDTAAESYPGEADDVGLQTIIRYPARHNWVQASADVLFYHTDNLFLLDHFTQEANVLLSTIEVDLTPPGTALAGGELFPRVGYRHQWYSFGAFGGHVDGSTVKLDTFDFNAGTAFADVNWRRNGWTLGGGFDYTRLAGTDSGDEFYSEYAARWNAGYSFNLCEKSAVSLGYDGDYRWSCPSGFYPLAGRDNLDRTDHSITTTLSYRLCSHAILQPYHRFKFTHFTGAPSRDDYLNTLGVGLYCPINQNIGVRFFTAWETRNVNGNNTTEDYRKFDIGGGVNLTFRF